MIIRREIETNLGIVSYRQSGDSGPFSLVFIHGVAGDSRLFSAQLKHFGQKYSTYAVDLPLHGLSITGFPQKLELKDYIEILKDFIEKVVKGDVFIVGHSMGAGLSVKLSTVLKNRILGYSLISSSVDLDVGEKLISLFDSDFDGFIRLFILLSFGRLGGVILKSYLETNNELSKEMVMNDLNVVSNLDYSEELSKISVPVHLVANHIPHFEKRKEFNSSLEKFLINLKTS